MATAKALMPNLTIELKETLKPIPAIAKINRFLPHTSDDDHSRYRDIDELSNQKDPIEIYKQFLLDNKFLTNDMAESLVLQINEAVDSATEYVESLPYPNKDTFYSHIYKTNE